jgi:hypothetical protein
MAAVTPVVAAHPPLANRFQIDRRRTRVPAADLRILKGAAKSVQVVVAVGT